MGVIWTSKTRTRQPTVWVPPNAQVRGEMVVAHDSRSLTIYSPKNGGVDGVFTTMSAEPSNPPFVYPAGIGLALDITHDRAELTSNIADGDSFSSLVLVNPYSAGLTGERYWLSRGRDGSGSGWSVGFGHNSSAKPILVLVLTSGGTAAYTVTGATTLAADVWTAVACVWDAVSGSMRIYVNGVLDGTTTPGATTLRTSSVNLVLGGLSDASSGSYFGRRGPLFLTKRVWLNSEIEAYSRNPWQLFAPEKRPLFFSTGGGSGSPYSLAVDAGSYVLTGVDATFKAGRTLTAESGSYALTGVAATLAHGHSLTAEAGSYSVTGVAATFQASRTILAGAGSYTISGQDATFTYTPVGSGSPYSMDADAGSYILTGVDATFKASRTIVAAAGSYALTGVDASFTRSEYRLVAETGSYTISGVEATFSTTAASASHGGGKTFGSNKKKKKQRKAIESEEWLKAEETAKQLLQDRFTKTTPEAKLEALASHIESLQPVIEALKALAREDVQEAVQETKTEELTEHQVVLNRFDALEKKIESVEELLIILMADL